MYNPDYFIATSSFRMKLVSFQWQRVQLKLTLSIEEVNIQGLDYYLFHPPTERTVYFTHIETVGELVHLRINVTIASEDQMPLPSGRWIVVAKNRENGNVSVTTTAPSLIDFVTVERDKNMDHYRKVFIQSGRNYYSVRPIANDENGLLYIVVFYKGENQKTERELAREMRRKKRRKRSLKFRRSLFITIYKLSLKIFGIKENRLLFTSDSRAELGGNMKFVHDRIVERGLTNQFRMKMLFKENITDRRSILDKFKLPYYLATSKTILLDDFHPLLYNLNFHKTQNIIQLWHATGHFKTVGYSRVGKMGGPDINGDTHKIYTSAIVGAEHSTPYYAEAFGMHEADVYATGVPRIDSFFDEAYKEATRNRLYNEFPGAKTAEKVILFAPTFRGSGSRTAHYPMYQIHLDVLAEYAKANKAVIIFKLHPFVRERISIPEKYEDIFQDAFEYREINDILLISDLVITDYSSVIFEYSLLNKPMIFFAFDYHQYTSSRDFYEGFRDFVPGKIVFTFTELMKALKEEDFEIEKVPIFRDKYFKYQDSRSTDRVIDWLILNNFPDEVRRGPKQSLLNEK